MSAIPPDTPTSDTPASVTNELAKARNYAAAERTLASWIQNCLSFIGFGIAVDRILLTVNQTFPGNDPILNIQLTHVIALIAIGTGILLLVLVVIGYLDQVKSLNQKNYLYQPLHHRYLVVIVGSVILISFMALFFKMIG